MSSAVSFAFRFRFNVRFCSRLISEMFLSTNIFDVVNAVDEQPNHPKNNVKRQMRDNYLKTLGK